MLPLLQTFWHILLLRESPETIPYSRFLLASVLLAQLLLAMGSSLILHTSAFGEFAVTLLGIGLLLGFSSLLLGIYGVQSRLVQTMTAIAGCEILLSLLALPVSVWLNSVDKAQSALPGMLSLMLIGWYVVVVAHIWRHALGVSRGIDYLFAMGYVIVTFYLAALV